MPSFTNKATLSFNGGSIDSNTVTGTFLQTLTAKKSALIDSYLTGTTLTYVISLINAGTSTFSALTLTDDLGVYSFGEGTLLYPLDYVEDSLAYYVNGTLQTPPTPTSTQPLVISGIAVPAGGSAILIYQATVNAYAPPVADGSIVNTVTVNGGGLAEEVTATETVTTLDAPNLSITKSLSPTEIVEDGALTYSFLIENSGNTAAAEGDGLTVSDVFDPILTISSVTLDGASLTEGTDYTYDAATGSFSTVAGIITVPAATAVQKTDGSYTVTAGSTTLVINGSI